MITCADNLDTAVYTNDCSTAVTVHYIVDAFGATHGEFTLVWQIQPGAPTRTCTRPPTADPTDPPTADPTANPTKNPTVYPTAYPNAIQTTTPTAHPTANPTANPTATPTANPTTNPTSNPTAQFATVTCGHTGTTSISNGTFVPMYLDLPPSSSSNGNWAVRFNTCNTHSHIDASMCVDTEWIDDAHTTQLGTFGVCSNGNTLYLENFEMPLRAGTHIIQVGITTTQITGNVILSISCRSSTAAPEVFENHGERCAAGLAAATVLTSTRTSAPTMRPPTIAPTANPTANPTGTTCDHVDSNGHLTIPEGQVDLAPSQFRGCTALRAVTFPTSLLTIGWSAFYGCSRLESIDLSATQVTGISGDGFGSCTALSATSHSLQRSETSRAAPSTDAQAWKRSTSRPPTLNP